MREAIAHDESDGAVLHEVRPGVHGRVDFTFLVGRGKHAEALGRFEIVGKFHRICAPV